MEIYNQLLSDAVQDMVMQPVENLIEPKIVITHRPEFVSINRAGA